MSGLLDLLEKLLRSERDEEKMRVESLLTFS